MVTGLTTEKVENVRIVLLTIVKEGIVRIARDLMPTMKEANARSVRTVTALMATVRNVLLTIVKAVIVRIVLASITIVKVATVRNVLTTAKVVLMVIVLNALPTIVKVVIVRIVRDLIRILTAATVLSVLTTVKAANNALMVIVRIVPVSIVVKVATVLSVLTTVKVVTDPIVRVLTARVANAHSVLTAVIARIARALTLMLKVVNVHNVLMATARLTIVRLTELGKKTIQELKEEMYQTMGNVIDAMEYKRIFTDERTKALLYACGPIPMMKAIQSWQAGYHMESWFSLEERMGCGFGACAGCPANLRMPDGSVMKKGVCKLGPVFPGEDVIFQ